MSLEQALAANTAAIEALTAALQAGGVPAATSTAAAEKPAKAEKAPKAEKLAKAEKEAGYEAKHDAREMQAALNKVKETKGVAEAKRIISEVGKAAKMAEITDPKLIDAVFDECEKVLGSEEDM